MQFKNTVRISLLIFIFEKKSHLELEKTYKPFLRWAGGKTWLLKFLHNHLPEEGFNINQLQNSWIFDRLSITDEDLKRSEKYREEAVRISYKSSVKSYKEFISGLNLQIEIIPFKDESIPRISQLTFKTNQFNFTTLRRSEVEIRNISADLGFDCFQVSLSDRFGEYGLIGVIIINKSTGYDIDTFLLSCRVLGKGVEHSLISFLGEKARLNNNAFLSIHFRKTPKNIPAQNFLVSNFGFLPLTPKWEQYWLTLRFRYYIFYAFRLYLQPLKMRNNRFRDGLGNSFSIIALCF